MFAQYQESARNCIERVLGVLQYTIVLFKRFGIIIIPGRLWCTVDLTYISKACAIIHNMCVEERRTEYIGDGVGGIRDDRIDRELSGQFSSLDMTSKSELVDSLNITPSDLYDNLYDRQRLKNALVKNISLMYGANI